MEYKVLVMIIKNLVILPLQEIKLELKDEISKNIIKISEKKYNNRLLVVSSLNNSPCVSDLAKVGVISFVKSAITLPNGNLRVTLKGEKRVRISKYELFSNTITGSRVNDIILPKLIETKKETLLRKLKEELNNYIDNTPSASNSILNTIKGSEDLNFITDVITTFLPINVSKKILYMQEINSEKRAINLIKDMRLELEYEKLNNKIDEEVNIKLNKEQEDFYLKEKLKEIENELGINDKKEINEYYDKLDKLTLKNKTRAKILNEIKRLENTLNTTPEYTVIRNYLDWIINLPWNTSKEECLDSNKVLKSLDKSHYGLEEVKSRIIDYVSIKNISKKVSTPIICLVGPPGVGKTTVSKSIADALNRDFFKISVGGLNDSSELIGNRRTYLGSLPGKIIQGIKKVNSNNPVILIDEIDKITKDYKGDPAAILLDVLDNNENKYFIDNYIEEPFDLSNSLFILTANDIKEIPYALLDRLEIININSYNLYEKLDIAKKYIIPSIIDELEVKKINIKDDVIINIINKYTNELGVRDLSRILKKIINKTIIAKKNSINNKELIKYLGKPLIKNNYKIDNSGVVNAIGVNNFGGEIIQVECAIYDGNDIITTGSLGNILKESIKVALSYIKENNLIDNKLLDNKTIHVHLIDGSSNKDGTSAGVSIVTSIISKCLNKKIDENTTFTGEITLSGKILKVGKIKEKIICAYDNNIKKIYIPYQNINDLEDVPSFIKDNIEIRLVNNYFEIYQDIFL